SHITSLLPASFDSHQFAYKENRSTEDAVATALRAVLSHLEKQGSYVWILFVDYSSAFNTILPHILVGKLEDLGLPHSTCMWINSFVSNHSQRVRVGRHTSTALSLSTGSPQGCVLSPLLYTLYTHDCTPAHHSNTIVKFVDETTVVGLISEGDELAYRDEVERCRENNLLNNTTKTKELIIDYRRKETDITPLYISGDCKMMSDPHLVVGSESRFDFAQGELGNCWFLAAIGAITFQPKIMDQIIPVGQSFRKDYAGIFHFRFWRFGKWVDVVIDDKLPTIDGQLIFVHCKTRNEFWPALLEKAYAKLCGSYADLHGGLISEALSDFIGGVHLTLRLKADHPEHWALLRRAEQYNSCMGCGSHAGATSANTELPNGIVEGHAYTVTGVTKVMSDGESVKLVRLLNPWGRKEWNGDWSDRENTSTTSWYTVQVSPLWESVEPEERSKLLQSKEDGEFWMSVKDFCRSFANVDICCQSPAFLDGSSEHSWTTRSYEGQWDEKTAGGSMENMQSFWKNPQFLVKISAGETDSPEGQGLNLLVSLIQKPNSRHRRHVQNHHIGFSVFAVSVSLCVCLCACSSRCEYSSVFHSSVFPLHSVQRSDSVRCVRSNVNLHLLFFLHQLKDQKAFPAAFFSSSAPVARSKALSNSREVTEYLRLKPGLYLIVPFTYKPRETGSFVLMLHSK
ncbi:hypothetical protein QTP86_014551, partial [Hemibagrus guttatus]